MNAVRPKPAVDAETRQLEGAFMAEMGKVRERLSREVEEALLDALEHQLGCPVTTKTPPRFKFTECDGQMVFTLIAFEAKVDA